MPRQTVLWIFFLFATTVVPQRAASETVAFLETVACPTGNFARYKTSIDADHIDQAAYFQLSTESNAVALLRREVCYDYKTDGLNDMQKGLLEQRISAANRCVEREVAAIRAEQFVNAVSYLRSERSVLTTIQQLLKFGTIRREASSQTKEGAKRLFEVSSKMLGLPTKAVESLEALAVGGEAARHFLPHISKDLANDFAVDAALDKLDPFEGLSALVQQQVDFEFKDRLSEIEKMNECR